MRKILIIDDQRDTLLILTEYLKREEYEVLTADNGKDGLILAEEEKPDLILLDIMMPEINGLELCHLISMNPLTAQIPIIFISARISPEDVRTGFQAGAEDYIKKPINRIELIERVNSVINRTDEIKELVKQGRRETFSATAIAANHKLKQPLTLINLSISALKRILNKDEFSKDDLYSKIETIQISVNQITSILNHFLRIEDPEIKNYIGGVKMIDLDEKNKDAENEEI